jgi:hypothetical protein
MEQLQLVEAATGKLVRLLEPGANVLGPELEYWARGVSRSLPGIGLWRAGGSAALVHLGVDTSPSGAIWSFHPSGSQLRVVKGIAPGRWYGAGTREDRRSALTTLNWLLVATGFTGALTLLYLLRVLYHSWHTSPSVQVHFSPKGGCTEAVVRELGQARHEVHVLAYSFTSKPIAQALVEAKLRGVHVEIILDYRNEQEAYFDLHFVLEQGLVPIIDAHHPISHNKPGRAVTPRPCRRPRLPLLPGAALDRSRR